MAPEGHLAHHASDLVVGFDLSALYAPYYEDDGCRQAAVDARKYSATGALTVSGTWCAWH